MSMKRQICKLIGCDCGPERGEEINARLVKALKAIINLAYGMPWEYRKIAQKALDKDKQ